MRPPDLKVLQRKHWLLTSVTAAMLLAAGASVWRVLSAPQKEGLRTSRECRQVTAVGFPLWVTTGVWHGQDLLLVDVARRKLVRVSSQGIAGEVTAAIGNYLESYNPTRIRSIGSTGGYVIELAGGKLLILDDNLALRRELELIVGSLHFRDNRIAALTDWVLAGSEVVGYADVEGAGEGLSRWKNGFVRFDLDYPSTFKMVRERQFPDAARVSMQLTYPYIASIGSTAYVVLISNQMGLWRLTSQDDNLEKMDSFPSHLTKVTAPTLPTFRDRADFVTLMGAVERATMPAGLFAWNDNLFVLSRAIEKSQRRWFLSKIDPRRDRLLWTVVIPSSAHHLSVVPGPGEWAFLEKGPVTDYLAQDTQQVLFVRSSQFEVSSLESLCN